jgi:hypothetical protein
VLNYPSEEYKEMNFKTLREKESALLRDLDTVRAAMRLLGEDTGSDKSTGRKRRKMSAATRKKMAASAKKRWAAKKEQ